MDRDKTLKNPSLFSFWPGPVLTTNHSTEPGKLRLLHVQSEKILRVRPAMTRGKKPEGMIDEAKLFAQRMGYRWTDNPHADLAFDFEIFKRQSVRLVKVRQTRYRLNPEAFYEDLFPDEIRGLRELPFPDFILRELWLRTRAERAWRRLIVYDFGISEIGWWGPDDYTNPYAR